MFTNDRPDVLIYRRRPWLARGRQMLDAAVATVALVIASPLLIAAAIAIGFEDGSPIIFSQRRVGRLGKEFVIFKLRTMKRHELGDRLSPRNASDARVTKIGRILRKTSVDELPQLINIIRGDMALVGPRPEMPFVVRNYRSWQHMRHLVSPGLTGLWQINARKTVSLERPEATLMDLEYIRTAAIFVDIRLLLKTARALASPKGAF